MNWEEIDILYKDKLAKPDETLKEHTDNLLNQKNTLKELEYIDDSTDKILELSIKLHDLGKINPYFQERIKSGNRYNQSKEVPHQILSLYLLILSDLLDDDLSCWEKAVTAHSVLNHHYRNRYSNKKYIKDIDNKKIIIDNMTKILSLMEENFDEDDIEYIREDQNDLLLDINEDKERAFLLLGLLNKCDYSASAHIPIEYKNDFLEEKMKKLLEEWKKYNDDAKWNDLQEFCIENKDSNIIAVGPTGIGKTEGALLWLGNNKSFFVLPLKTAINAIYDRIKNNVIKNENIDERIALLHGETIDIYSNEKENIDILEYFEKSKQLSLPLTVCTPDQIFDFAYKAKGFEFKYATLSYSKVVIDEIQSYSQELMATLISGIHNIIDIGGKVAILTATMPPFILDLLSKNIINKKEYKFKLYPQKEEEYKISEDAYNDYKIRHNMFLYDDYISDKVIYEHYVNNESKNKKYLVICNTIASAQKIYENLKDKGLENVYLLHSKYTKIDRSQKEKEIIDAGKTLNNNGEMNYRDEIWISTQIVEASLDIDFDYLFTELSDLNSLFQRFGRINRKGKKSAEKYNCFVFTKINEKLFLNKKNSYEYTGFIDKGIFELSKDALEYNGNGILSENKKIKLINTFLTTEKLKNKKEGYFLTTFKDSYEYISQLAIHEVEKEKTKKKFRNIISYTVFPCDIEKGIINETEIKDLVEKIDVIKEQIKNEKEDKKARENLFIEYKKLISELEKYTVSIGYYDYIVGKRYMSDCRRKINKFNHVKDSEVINSNRKIDYILCKYDDRGFVRLTKADIEAKDFDTDFIEKQDEYDNFI